MNTPYLAAPVSHGDDLAQLSLGEYASSQSDLASQAALLFHRLANGGLNLDDPRLVSLIEPTRRLVQDVREAKEHEHERERDLGVHQLVPVRVWRQFEISQTAFLRLADEIAKVLLPGANLPPVERLREFADALDDLNLRLQRRADESIASLHVL